MTRTPRLPQNAEPRLRQGPAVREGVRPRPAIIGLTRRGDGIGRGEPAQTVEELRPYKDAGVTVVLLTFIGPNADAVGEKMAAFMRDVAGSV